MLTTMEFPWSMQSNRSKTIGCVSVFLSIAQLHVNPSSQVWTLEQAPQGCG